MAMMTNARLHFYDEQHLTEKQKAAAQNLPVATQHVVWTEEEEELFTEDQKFLVQCKVNGASYKTMREYFALGSDNSVASALRKTALGFVWHPHRSGGSSQILSDVYVNRLKKLVHERCMDLNAMRTVEIMDFFC